MSKTATQSDAASSLPPAQAREALRRPQATHRRTSGPRILTFGTLWFGAAMLFACTESSLRWEEPLDASSDADIVPEDTYDGDADDAEPLEDVDASPEVDAATDTTPDTDEPPLFDGATRYLNADLRSPLSLSLLASVDQIRRNATLPWPAFIKVGASETVNPLNLTCLQSTSPSAYYEGAFAPSLAALQQVESPAGGLFERASLAGEVGRSADWPLASDPSPLDDELSANPGSIALVSFGTNDMQQGSDSSAALFAYGANQSALLRELQTRGVVPVVIGLHPRSDSDEARWWVESFNSLARGLAERDQLPWLNLYQAMRELPNLGLTGDGVHANVYREGGLTQPCATGETALRYGYNLRNLLTMELLDALLQHTEGDVGAEPASGWRGTGTTQEPLVIDELPFTHFADTRSEGQRLFDAYPACDTGQDESAPELVYRLELSERRSIRAFVYDEGAADIDLHLLAGEASASACIERNDRILQRTLEPGTYYLVADTYVRPTGDERSGEFVLVVVECDPADPSCW